MLLPIVLAVAALLLFGLVLLMARNRWIQRHPLRACVVLSLVAHVLLAIGILASNILRLPTLPPGDGAIMVQIEPLKPTSAASSSTLARTDPEAVPNIAAAEPTVVPEPVETEPEEPEPPPADPQPADPPPETSPSDDVEPPALDPPTTDFATMKPTALSAAEEPPDPEPVTESEALPMDEPPSEALATQEPPDAAAGERLETLQAEISAPTARPLNLLDPQPAAAALAETPPAELAPLPTPRESQTAKRGEWAPELVKQADLPAPGRYAGRSLAGRARQTVLRGGSAKTEAAVVAALEWLVRVQEADGRWSARQHGAGRGGFIEGQVRGTTGIHADTGLTGLALLALLAHGETSQEGQYADAVASGLRYLRAAQRPSGDLGGDAGIHARMYCHGMAMLALAEAYAMTGDTEVRDALRAAIAYSVRCQDRYSGGWRYRPGESGDTSQLGWQVMALTSARRAGIRDGDQCLAGIRHFLDSVSSGSAGGLAAYRPGGAPTRSMTAEALVCRWCLGDVEAHVQDEASHFIMQQPPGVGTSNFYYWYYASLALCQLEDENWDDWNRHLQRVLLSEQRRRGALAGSWDPTTQWGPCGGRVYTTAVATLCLEVYYRYAPQAPLTAEGGRAEAR
ncbi:MAG: hypothetical protein AAGF97_10420 [Planctomycetota bacterium]